MLNIKALKFILILVLLNIIIVDIGTCEAEYTTLPSDSIERDMYEISLANVATFSALWTESNPLLKYYLAYMEADEKSLLFETNYQSPRKILIMLPNDGQSSLIQRHLSLNTDYRIPNLAGLALNCTYQANYTFSNTTLYAECYEQLSCYNVCELHDFGGIGYIIFEYDDNAPQVVTAFYTYSDGQVIVKSTITYIPNMSVVFDSDLDYLEYGIFPYAARTLLGDDSFIIHEYSVE